MYCPNCGSYVQNGASFCASCGARIEPQQQNPYHQDGWYGDNQSFAPVPPSADVTAAESKSVASLVMGIISIVAGFFLAGLVLGPLAIVKSKQARSVLSQSNHNFWIALAGGITGIAGLVVSIIGAIYWFVFTIATIAAMNM
jgi:hypothetical protein